MKKQLKTLNDTAKFAQELADSLKGGEVLALKGLLGAGKTTLTQNLAKALGVKAQVTSPTFVLLKVYKTKHPTVKRLVHIDAYRLRDGEDLAAVGWDDYLDAETVIVIEWADKVKEILPPATRWLKLVLDAKGVRTVTF